MNRVKTLKKGDITLPQDLNRLAETIREHQIGLVIFDPFEAFVDTKFDMHRSHHVRRIVGEVDRVCEEAETGTITLRHLNKNSQETDPMYRAMGSIGITAAGRAALMVGYDPTDQEPDPNRQRRILAPVKMNLGPRPKSLAFGLVVEQGEDHPAVGWIGPSEVKDRDLTAVQKPDRKRPRQEAALALIEEELGGGWRMATEVETRAEQEGVSHASLMRAKRKLEVVSTRVGGAREKGRSVWWVPEWCEEGFDPGKDRTVLAQVENHRLRVAEERSKRQESRERSLARARKLRVAVNSYRSSQRECVFITVHPLNCYAVELL